MPVAKNVCYAGGKEHRLCRWQRNVCYAVCYAGGKETSAMPLVAEQPITILAALPLQDRSNCILTGIIVHGCPESRIEMTQDWC